MWGIGLCSLSDTEVDVAFIMPQRSKIRGHIVFVLSVIPSFFHSVILSFCHSLWNFNLANNFWRVNARALIFHMSISCDKKFLKVPLFFTMWPWPWSLTYFKKNFNLANDFWTVNARVLIFHMSIPCVKTFSWVSIFLHCDLDLEFDPFFQKFYLAYIFWTVNARALKFVMSILVIRHFRGYHYF